MSISANGKRVEMLTRELANQWDQTKHYWTDSKTKEFEHEYIEELLASVENSVTVIEQLDKLVNKVRHDCE
jgi:hypothetical protein